MFILNANLFWIQRENLQNVKYKNTLYFERGKYYTWTYFSGVASLQLKFTTFMHLTIFES